MKEACALVRTDSLFPTLLLIDAETERAQKLARLLTLAGYRPLVASAPLPALQRLLQTPFTPEAILLGQIDFGNAHSILPHLLARLRQQSGEAIPTLGVPDTIPDEPPLGASSASMLVHTPAPQALKALEPLWQTLPHTRWYSNSVQPSLVVSTLPDYQLKPRVTQEARSSNAHFRLILQAAYEVIGAAAWDQALSDVGLARYRLLADWPPDDKTRAIPAEFPSLLHQAVAFSAPAHPIEQVSRWSEWGTHASFSKRSISGLTKQAVKLMPKNRLLALTLQRFAQEMDDIRGEALHAYIPWEAGDCWLVHYSNLYIYGRLAPPETTCQVWLSSLETTLRLVGLEEMYLVSEIECSSQTQTGHCLFAIQSR